MSISVMFFALWCAVTAQPDGSLPSSVTINHCLVSFEKEAEVPAQEPGLHISLPVQEGDLVKNDKLLSKIEDSLQVMEHRVAQNKWEVAKLEAKNDTNLRFARAATDVAWADCKRDDVANKNVTSAVA
jgi:multidrug efflux pump subunit AcrA (membrane-fusion protein)